MITKELNIAFSTFSQIRDRIKEIDVCYIKRESVSDMTVKELGETGSYQRLLEVIHRWDKYFQDKIKEENNSGKIQS